MASTLLRRLKNILRLLVPMALLGTSGFSAILCAQTETPRQNFACNIGYSQQACDIATSELRKALARYPVSSLGEWTWVLVRTVDWKQALSQKRIDPNDPAFSNLTGKVTFLDGSLVDRVSIRGMELRTVWHMSIEDLLDLTIRHELAHALCNERDEIKAGQLAIALKKDRASLSCPGTRDAKSRTDGPDSDSVVRSNRREAARLDPERSRSIAANGP